MMDMTEAKFRQLWNGGEVQTSSIEELTGIVDYMEEALPSQSSTGRLIIRNNIFKVRELIAQRKLASELNTATMSA